MEGTRKILRRTVHTFLRSYCPLATVVALLAAPASASFLLSQALLPAGPALHRAIRSRLRSLFEAAGFPASEDFFVAIDRKLSQTIFSYAVSLPFALTFLVAAKAAVVHVVCRRSPRRGKSLLPAAVRLYPYLLSTYVCGAFAMLTANAAVFSLLLVAFNVAELLGVGATFALCTVGAVAYSVVLAHVAVSCNLATVVSGVENSWGLLPLLKAFLLVRERTATALTLALLGNVGMASVEALFQYRVVRPCYMSNELRPSLAWEFLAIAYIHSLLLVLDTTASCVFFESCWGCCSDGLLPGWNLGVGRRFGPLEVDGTGRDPPAISKCQELLP